MTLTLSIPTWDAIKNFVAVVVLYYGTWVAPQFDWYIFGVAYFLGILTLCRDVYREPRDYDIDKDLLYFLCIFWIIFIPLFALIRFTVFYVTFANKPVENKGL